MPPLLLLLAASDQFRRGWARPNLARAGWVARREGVCRKFHLCRHSKALARHRQPLTSDRFDNQSKEFSLMNGPARGGCGRIFTRPRKEQGPPFGRGTHIRPAREAAFGRDTVGKRAARGPPFRARMGGPQRAALGKPWPRGAVHEWVARRNRSLKSKPLAELACQSAAGASFWGPRLAGRASVVTGVHRPSDFDKSVICLPFVVEQIGDRPARKGSLERWQQVSSSLWAYPSADSDWHCFSAAR